MTGKIRVIKAPECGYVPLGPGTYAVGTLVDISNCDEDEVNSLLKQGYIELIVGSELQP